MSWIKKAKESAERDIQEALDKEELSSRRVAEAQQRDSDLIRSAKEEGFIEGFRDFEQRLANSNQWAPVVEGSPQDIQIQEDVNRGLNYQEPEEPSLLDSISGYFGSGNDTAPTPEDAPQSAFLQGQKFDAMQQESEQAGLAELEQILNNQQR